MEERDPKTRFKFGKNWMNFLKHLDDDRIEESRKGLESMLETTDLTGKRFLDIGSGSGLSSLVARKMGAEVLSFDYDEQSVACTKYLKETYFKDDPNWHIEQGSVLNKEYLESLGEFDIVYSWGVLHHTGDMKNALSNVDVNVKNDGKLFIAIYNNQGYRSKVWHKVKSTYVKSPKIVKHIIVLYYYFKLKGKSFLYDVFIRRKPLYTYNSKSGRGMSSYYDLIDWVGGYPFEVATPEFVFDFYRNKNYKLEKLKTCGKGYGCNEFVFTKI